MISNKLSTIWKSNKFPSSWIIEGHNHDYIYQEIILFIQKEIDNTILSSPDLLIIKRIATNKNITIEQTRTLQQWLFKNSINENKFAIIYEADLMNINAANCCLKILEDTPKNSYIFLLTSNYHLLINTIISRCRILHSNTNYKTDTDHYKILIESLINKDINLLIDIKNNTLTKFQASVTLLLNRILKFHLNLISLSKLENTLINKLPKYSLWQLILKTEKLINTMNEAYIYNMDYTHTIILIFNKLLS